MIFSKFTFMAVCFFSGLVQASAQGSIPTANHRITEYPKMAVITSVQAVKSALHKVDGDLLSVGLENGNGFLVYAVEIVNPVSGLHEINIDAGTAKIISDRKKDRVESKPNDDHDND